MIYYGVYLFMWFFVYNLVRIDLGLELDSSFFGWFVLPNIILGVPLLLIYWYLEKNPKEAERLEREATRIQIEKAEQKQKQRKGRKYDGYIHGVRKVTWFAKRRFK